MAKFKSIKTFVWLDVDVFATGNEKGELTIHKISQKNKEEKKCHKLCIGGSKSSPPSIHSTWLIGITPLQLSPSLYRLASASSDGTISLWKFEYDYSEQANHVLFPIAHLWSDPDFALVEAVSFSPTGTLVAFSKSNRIHVRQLHIPQIMQVSATQIIADTVNCLGASSLDALIPPSRVCSIFWSFSNGIRVYTQNTLLINLQIDTVSNVLTVESDESDKLNDLLKQVKAEKDDSLENEDDDGDDDDDEVDEEDDVDEGQDEESIPKARALASKKLFLVAGVHSSYHGLIDTVCFQTESGSKASTYVFYLLLYLEVSLDRFRIHLFNSPFSIVKRPNGKYPCLKKYQEKSLLSKL